LRPPISSSMEFEGEAARVEVRWADSTRARWVWSRSMLASSLSTTTDGREVEMKGVRGEMTRVSVQLESTARGKKRRGRKTADDAERGKGDDELGRVDKRMRTLCSRHQRSEALGNPGEQPSRLVDCTSPLDRLSCEPLLPPRRRPSLSPPALPPSSFRLALPVLLKRSNGED
jgi:hypothetical protein